MGENRVLFTNEPVGPSLAGVMREFEGCRFVIKGDDFWIVAKDVVERALGKTWHHTAVRHVPDKWKGSERITTLGGTQAITTLSEQGLYFLLARSDSSKALPFQERVAETFKKLRQEGRVELAPLTREQRQALALVEAHEIIAEKDAALAEAHEQLAIAAPKVAYSDALAAADKSNTPTEVWKEVAPELLRPVFMGSKKARTAGVLGEAGLAFREASTGVLLPYQPALRDGLVSIGPRLLPNGSEITQLYITDSGRRRLVDLVAKRRALACAGDENDE